MLIAPWTSSRILFCELNNSESKKKILWILEFTKGKKSKFNKLLKTPYFWKLNNSELKENFVKKNFDPKFSKFGGFWRPPTEQRKTFKITWKYTPEELRNPELSSWDQPLWENLHPKPPLNGLFWGFLGFQGAAPGKYTPEELRDQELSSEDQPTCGNLHAKPPINGLFWGFLRFHGADAGQKYTFSEKWKNYLETYSWGTQKPKIIHIGPTTLLECACKTPYK